MNEETKKLAVAAIEKIIDKLDPFEASKIAEKLFRLAMENEVKILILHPDEMNRVLKKRGGS